VRKATYRIIAAGLVLFAAMALTACAAQPATPETPAVDTPAAETPGPEALISVDPPAGMADVTELKVEDIKVGTGAEAKTGDNVTVHYSGWLVDGTKFDSSVDSGQPFTFGVGKGEVIAGWDQGVEGMKVGGVRRLTIPASLGYGDEGAGGGAIPPGATLVFDVALLAVN